MYFVDRKKIESTLLYMEGLMQEYQNHDFESFLEKLSLERITHMTIEAVIDVGNMMIDGFIMRDPGSYEDIIDILTDEKVIPESHQEPFKNFIRLRRMLIQDYLEIEHTVIEKSWKNTQGVLETFPASVRKYLDEELGPVSAFSNS
ncbi:hypothetical protein GCM10007216_10050 [Thalassobacillus devorans]|uniref:DUF86 domain-containing protein n=1 Tax=Thalassobacillus devorans TaxID=279813 RepID=A0ABQ1NS09_9BACI|nr:DUF86 domain-containing protein [Thalassobacillus devorans]NIK29056.1 uncharacterized protein YutE (UPF0331/DUF86 family) [Thalassobacillus devorans]GGC81503.1 hypothetical protein GCM10007216_10050 [Thalassobacillus devorans]